MLFVGRIKVTLKPTINDPQGRTISNALARLGFDGLQSLRAGKYFEATLEAEDAAQAESAVRDMCEKLLANPVIERYEFDVEPAKQPARSG